MNNNSDEYLRTEIYGYCRISVDDELDKDNTSIENQKDIIEDYVKKKFPKAHLSFFVDRDCSGYTFEQRKDYQKMRKKLIAGEGKILIVKDFSRFSRRNSKGLVELEDLRDAGVRIISISDSIDYPTFDDWMTIQFRFLINEMPVTDTSKKVKGVIQRMQEEGKWICAVPYGYILGNSKKQQIVIEPEAAEVVKKIFSLYNEGYGYKKIANYLTDNNIPTPRMRERELLEERGEEIKGDFTNRLWSDSTIQEILANDFYIGTLRQNKYKRKKINGKDIKVDSDEHIVFENHHEAIIDNKTWIVTQDEMKKRSSTAYRGVKIHDNIYAGFMVCGDCGSPMISNNRNSSQTVYICGMYHKRGLKGCTSHHTRTDVLDEIIKQYVMKVRDNSSGMLKQLETSIKNDANQIDESTNTIGVLARHLNEAKEELKAIKKRKIKEIARMEAQLGNDADFESKIEIIEETYADLETETMQRINGLQKQISAANENRNKYVKLNRMTKTVLDVFNDIINKPKLDRTDLQLIIDRIIVYKDHIDIKLKADVDAILRSNTEKEDTESSNFNQDSKVILKLGNVRSVLFMERGNTPTSTKYQLRTSSQHDRLFTVNVVQRGGAHAVEVLTPSHKCGGRNNLQKERKCKKSKRKEKERRPPNVPLIRQKKQQPLRQTS
jgi:DNA invertase Pin-like site-specific DNA recombinase